jgi:predicted dehydrogenase
MQTSQRITRRKAIAASAAAAATIAIVPRHVLGAGETPPSETLNIAGVGIGGMGTGDVQNLANLKQNIVALCDPDHGHLDGQVSKYPKAKLYADYRKMFEQKDIDAVTIATPDHVHALVAIMAMKLGKHVHCQKPLTHSVYEARKMAEVARETKVATQMGNFGHSSEAARVICETIWSGAIGKVTEVHAGSNRYPTISERGVPRPGDAPAVPANLNWDLWVGPSPMRPYHPCYHPFSWRGWWDFGTGVLGDIGCHQLSAVFKALKLGHPAWVDACSSNHDCSPEIRKETAPKASITRWFFPAEGDRGPVTITWWDGGMKPPRPDELEPGRAFGENDWLYIVGDKGKMYEHRIIPESRAKEIGPPPKKLARSPGHYVEWVNACKGGAAAPGSNFVDHAAHLTEVVLLGNISIRTGEKIYWDGPNLRVTNSPEAQALVNPPYRAGYSL